MTDLREFTETDKSIVSEYKIGNTDYYVQLYFDLQSENTLEDIVKRMIIKDVTEISAV